MPKSQIFVPSTFELNQNTTSLDIQRSDGFKIGVGYEVKQLDEIEDRIENFKESRESQPNYEGRWLDIQRDGKTVWASETQNHYNHYQAVLSFQPTEHLEFSVTSYYHTLEEIIPIFNSVMN